MEGVDPFGSPVDERYVHLGAGEGDDQPGHPGSRAQIKHRSGVSRQRLGEVERVGDDVVDGAAAERTFRLSSFEDGAQPGEFVG